MKRVFFLMFLVLGMVGCSKNDNSAEEDAKKKAEIEKIEKEKIEKEKAEKERAENKKNALIYFELAKTNLNNRLNRTKEHDFWKYTFQALDISKGHEEVYAIIEDFLNNTRFATPKPTDEQQAELDKLIEKLKPQIETIKKYPNIKEAVEFFNLFKDRSK